MLYNALCHAGVNCNLVCCAVLWYNRMYILHMHCRRRPMSGTANPRGGKDPYISPEGHTICDIRFYEGLKLFGEDAAVSWCIISTDEP